MAPESSRDAARRAFIHWFASVDLYKTLHDFVMDPASPAYKGPFNTWAHERRLADPSDATIVAMNVDTPYSYAWLDLRGEPVVVTLPPFEPDRYMSAMLVDLHVQHTSPGPDRDANWLPCPAGQFGLTFRTYLPMEPIRAGTWTAPPVRKAD